MNYTQTEVVVAGVVVVGVVVVGVVVAGVMWVLLRFC